MPLSNVPTDTLKQAAKAWRNNTILAHQSWLASGPFKFLMAEPELSIHDRVDDLIEEIERLRRKEGM
jgi:hypothetical protein